MINIYLCDDDETILEKIISVLKRLSSKHMININITTYLSGELLLYDTYENLNEIDIIYLDINMEKINGIEVASKLREQSYNGSIIYLTTLRNYVFQCFDTSPLNYIIKTELYSNKFERVFLKAVSTTLNNKKHFFLCKNSLEFRKIPLHYILYFEINNRIVTVHYIDKLGVQYSFGFYSKISKIMNILKQENFVKIHRSFLVNLEYIYSLKSNSLKLFSGEELPIGKTYLKFIKKIFDDSLSSDFIGLQ